VVANKYRRGRATSDNYSMRIAFLTHQWPGIRMGGIGTCVRQTAAAMAQAGHDVHVFTFGIPPELRAATPEGVRLHEVAGLAERTHVGALSVELAAAVNAGGEGVYRLALGWLLCGALLAEHRERPFDVVEAPEVEGLALPLLTSSTLNAPVITHLHCCTAIAQATNGVAIGEAEHLINALEFAAIQLADAVCAPTRAVVGATERFTPVASPVIIPHPFVTEDAEFVAPPANGPMLFVGRIERLKGVEAIAQALNSVLPPLPGATFRFIGPDTNTAPGGGSMREHLRSLLSPEIAGRVVFAGERSTDEVAAELRGCSFCVLPSLAENFSMACCEAMAAGRTVIVGRDTGSVEVVGDAGVAVRAGSAGELADAMRHLWVDRRLLAELSHKAHERVRSEFEPDRIAAKRAAFYSDAIRSFDGGKERARRLGTLPAASAAALLPALTSLTGMLAGVHRPAHSPGARLLAVMERLARETRAPAKVRLYGAGKHTARLLAERGLWEARGHRVVGLIDDHRRFADHARYLELPVCSLNSAAAGTDGTDQRTPVVLSTDTYQDQFWTQTRVLRDRGIAVFRLY